MNNTTKQTKEEQKNIEFTNLMKQLPNTPFMVHGDNGVQPWQNLFRYNERGVLQFETEVYNHEWKIFGGKKSALVWEDAHNWDLEAIENGWFDVYAV